MHATPCARLLGACGHAFYVKSGQVTHEKQYAFDLGDGYGLQRQQPVDVRCQAGVDIRYLAFNGDFVEPGLIELDGNVARFEILAWNHGCREVTGVTVTRLNGIGHRVQISQRYGFAQQGLPCWTQVAFGYRHGAVHLQRAQDESHFPGLLGRHNTALVDHSDVDLALFGYGLDPLEQIVLITQGTVDPAGYLGACRCRQQGGDDQGSRRQRRCCPGGQSVSANVLVGDHGVALVFGLAGPAAQPVAVQIVDDKLPCVTVFRQVEADRRQ